MLEAKRAAKRSAEISTSVLREDDINSAEKNDTRSAGTPATFGGDGVPTDAGSSSEAPLSEPILPTVESVTRSSSGSAASVMTNTARTPWTPTLPSTSYGGSSMSDKSYSMFQLERVRLPRSRRNHTSPTLLLRQALVHSLC